MCGQTGTGGYNGLEQGNQSPPKGSDREKEKETDPGSITKEGLSGFSEFGVQYIALKVFGDLRAEMRWVKDDIGSKELRQASGWSEQIQESLLLSGGQSVGEILQGEQFKF